MLEKVEFDNEPLSKEEYKAKRDALMERLVVLQQQARSEGVGLVVLFEGWSGAGKGSRISDLMYNLDARATSVHVSEDVDQAALRRFPGKAHGVSDFHPFMQQYWKALGERGTITFFDRGWYSAAMQRMMAHAADESPSLRDEARRYATSVRDFERQLTDDGYVVVKLFLHVSKKAQRKRLERLHEDPATRWRVPDAKLASAWSYEEERKLYGKLLEVSNFDFAPWTVIDGEDKRRANIAIASALVDAIEGALARKRAAAGEAGALRAADVQVVADVDPEPAAPASSAFPIVADYPRIDEVDHGLAMDPDEYRPELKKLQKRLRKLENVMYQKRVPLMIMYEGWDAAGKGGNIKRVAQALDARAYTIFPSPAPTKPEFMHPHLWRYWTRLPKAGHVGIYDRSWYGRVLVERVEGFATHEQWSRAYDEINQFERDMVDWGAILLKFWVDVSPQEQLRRFEDRASDPAKRWKITDEDWRNREKYPQYKQAIDDMFRLTSTTFAPWVVLESDDKPYARIKALRIIVDALEERLEHADDNRDVTALLGL